MTGGRSLVGTRAAAQARTVGWANDRPLEPIGHVHALVAPSWLRGDVLVGTHQGLLRWSEADGWRTVGGDRHDLMGLAADPERAGVLYASGHPDLRSGLGNPLGLIVSQDAGRTWDARSRVERSDFHALVATSEAVWGWDVINASMVRSLDGGHTWERGDDGGFTATAMVFALAADAEPDRRAFAATRDGVWATEDDRTWRPLAFRGVAVTALHLASDGGLWAYVAGGDTGLVRSPDRGATWAAIMRSGDPR